MLVLTRKSQESLTITVNGTEVEVYVLHTSTGRCSLGVVAPKEVQIRRGELATNPAKMAGITG
jgi:carbon storage regulator CsrA